MSFDPGEKFPLSGVDAQPLADLVAVYEATGDELRTRANVVAHSVPLDDETRARLRALGYVE